MQPPELTEQKRLLSDAADDTKQADLAKPDFWELAAKGDLDLTDLLIQAADDFKKAKRKRTEDYKKNFAGRVDEKKKTIVKAYLNAWQRGGSVLKMNSVLEQLDFIVDALAIGQSESKFERQYLTAAIQHVAREIDREMEAEE